MIVVQRVRTLALPVVAAAVAAAAGCASDKESAPAPAPPPAVPIVTAAPPGPAPPPPVSRPTAPPPAPGAKTPALSPFSEVGSRLQAAGLRVVRQPLPEGVSGVESALVTASGPVTVFVYVFEAIDPAAAFARSVASDARRSDGSVLGRRVGLTVYVGTATDARGRGELERQVERVVKAGEHALPPPPAASPPASPAPAAPAAPAAPETAQGRLRAAGFRVVSQPLPKGVPGVLESFLTPAGRIVVYVYVFEAIDPARAYAARTGAQAGQSGGNVLSRRVGETVYVGTSTDARGRRQLRDQLDRVVDAAEG